MPHKPGASRCLVFAAGPQDQSSRGPQRLLISAFQTLFTAGLRNRSLRRDRWVGTELKVEKRCNLPFSQNPLPSLEWSLMLSHFFPFGTNNSSNSYLTKNIGMKAVVLCKGDHNSKFYQHHGNKVKQMKYTWKSIQLLFLRVFTKVIEFWSEGGEEEGERGTFNDSFWNTNSKELCKF